MIPRLLRESLQFRRRRVDLIKYYKIHHNLNTVNWISPNELVPALSAEGPAKGKRGEKDNRLKRQSVKSCLPRDNFLKNRIIPDKNNLPDHIINASSVNSLKNKLDKNFSY